MLRKIRVSFAVLFFVLITLLFLDFTGTVHTWFGWMAKIQFLPALLALNFGVVVLLVLLTFIFGRIYCSVVCPLGVFQDIISWMAGKRKKNRFRYSKAVSWLRYGVLGIFVVALIAVSGHWSLYWHLIARTDALHPIFFNLFICGGIICWHYWPNVPTAMLFIP